MIWASPILGSLLMIKEYHTMLWHSILGVIVCFFFTPVILDRIVGGWPWMMAVHYVVYLWYWVGAENHHIMMFEWGQPKSATNFLGIQDIWSIYVHFRGPTSWLESPLKMSPFNGCVSGSYSILAPVHPRFQLLVCIKASDVKQMPLPFLNRSLDCQGIKFKLEGFPDSLVIRGSKWGKS